MSVPERRNEKFGVVRPPQFFLGELERLDRQLQLLLRLLAARATDARIEKVKAAC